MAKFTKRDFEKMYPTNAACLDKLFRLRYGKLEACPKCQCKAEFRRITTRRAYQCKHCYSQFYPTANTPFDKTRVPLQDWFFAIYLFSTTRNGVSAKELQRQLGVTYKCAWRMGHCIRLLIGGMDIDKLKGFVEFDESYHGSSPKNWSKEKRKASKEAEQKRLGRGLDTKTPIFAMIERQGRVRAFHVPNVTKDSIFKLIRDNVDTSAKVSTDEFPLYKNLSRDLGIKQHGIIRHHAEQYRKGWVSTNTVEGFFSHLKRMIKGTHIQVSHKYLQNYINESCFRHNNRHEPELMFHRMIKQVKPVIQ
jgi:transposase-like protein